MKISLHSNQGIVFQSTSRFKVLAAGRRFGKTILACVILFVDCLRVKNGLFWYVSPTYRQTKQIAWKILLNLIPSQVLAKKPNETELSFHFKNGTELVLKGADNPDSLRGTGLDGLVIDEYASIRYAKSVWEEVLRPSLTDKLGWCLFIGTPKGKNAFWEIWMKGQRKEDGYESWSFKTSDNPFIQRSEIKEAQEQLSPRFFRQEFEDSFEDYTGLIWPEFDGKIHVIDQIVLPGHYERIGALDPAVTGTTASLAAHVNEDGDLFISQEYYEKDKRASEVAEIVKGRADTWFCDPAGNKKTENKNGVMFSLFDEYAEHGMHMRAAQNDVTAGINRVAEYFKAGKIKIFSNCHNLIRELERYHWSEEKETSNGVLEPKPFKSMDHLCDCLRYLVMSRSEAKPLNQVKIVKNSAAWFLRAHELQEQQESMRG